MRERILFRDSYKNNNWRGPRKCRLLKFHLFSLKFSTIFMYDKPRSYKSLTRVRFQNKALVQILSPMRIFKTFISLKSKQFEATKIWTVRSHPGEFYIAIYREPQFCLSCTYKKYLSSQNYTTCPFTRSIQLNTWCLIIKCIQYLGAHGIFKRFSNAYYK